MFGTEAVSARAFSVLTLLFLSSRSSRGCGERHRRREGAVELASDVSLEAAADLTSRLAFAAPAADIGLGPRTAPHAGHGDGVRRAVQGSVAAPVEPMPDGAATARR